MTCFLFSLFIGFLQAQEFSLPQQQGNFAIYWGCFDPPTLAHREIITELFRESLHIDSLW